MWRSTTPSTTRTAFQFRRRRSRRLIQDVPIWTTTRLQSDQLQLSALRRRTMIRDRMVPRHQPKKNQKKMNGSRMADFFLSKFFKLLSVILNFFGLNGN
ncbi:hypothetical protein L5515_010738 [Caenorhabditis briggsae]|uniref:Uncharacterized protein n=1 Tax=Caenorhabditis briggsae TaxID=6238 RepID=A0AAE9EMY6_CAEBR|nr:hypothetical protein L5515_010738 [Caenorhabditis briggsae]